MNRRTGLLMALLGMMLYWPRDASFAASATQPAADVEIGQAVDRFYNSLTPEQQSKALFAFADAERTNWNFTPVPRKGLAWKEMTPAQRELGQALLRVSLSQRGYDKAKAIQEHETILGQLENSTSRDPDNYYITLFGKPDAKAPWGWRFEGHHVAFNFTFVDGDLKIGAPHFLGANPAKVLDGPQKGLRILAAEEDLGRKLITSLTPEQRRIAIFTDVAPREIVTGNSKKIDPLQPVGIAAAQLSEDQRTNLMQLIQEYSGRLRADLAAQDWQKINTAGVEKIQFGWAGSVEVGAPHYYRIQGPTFLIEYDDTQNNANHIHAVWRDFANDFGADLLRAHYQQQPHAMN